MAETKVSSTRTGDANRLKPMTDEQREIFMAEIKAAQAKNEEKNIEIGAMQELSKEQRAKFMAEVKADMEAYEKSKAKNFNKGGTVGTPRTGFQDYRKNRFR
tara:strand:+ start:1048 stop:1353 length:306 start_codon:yes stop_codon:yes gene_type:complete